MLACAAFGLVKIRYGGLQWNEDEHGEYEDKGDSYELHGVILAAANKSRKRWCLDDFTGYG